MASPVVRLFRRLYPELETPVGLDADDALATLGIVRTPQALTISGPVSIEGLGLPRLRFYGVPAEQGDALGLAAPVGHVLPTALPDGRSGAMRERRLRNFLSTEETPHSPHKIIERVALPALVLGV